MCLVAPNDRKALKPPKDDGNYMIFCAIRSAMGHDGRRKIEKRVNAYTRSGGAFQLLFIVSHPQDPVCRKDAIIYVNALMTF